MSNYELPTILDYIPQLKDGQGFFSAFVNPVWHEVFTSPSQLDLYFAANYGGRHPANILDMYVDPATGHISAQDVTTLAAIIYSIRGKEWEHLFDELIVEYNPAENTDVSETYTDATTGSTTAGNTRTLNTQTTNNGSGSVTSSATGSGSNANNKFGFDSATAVGDTSGSDSSTTSSTTNTTTGNTVADTGTITDSGTGSETRNLTHTSRRHGNLGVMTFEQLLSGDKELWSNFKFVDTICQSICDIIALKVY